MWGRGIFWLPFPLVCSPARSRLDIFPYKLFYGSRKKNWGKVPTVDGWVRIVPNFYKSLFYDIFYKKKFKLFWQIHVKSPKSMILRGVLVPNLCGGWGGSQVWDFFQNKTVFYGIPSSFFSTACECFSVHDYVWESGNVCDSFPI